MDAKNISVAVECDGATTCVYKKDDVHFTISIRNIAGQDIAFPFEYIKKAGPIIKLVDSRTGQESYLKRNLADRELMKRLTSFLPSGHQSFEWVITPTELEQFGHETVDVVAEVSISTSVLVHGKTVEQVASVSMPIKE